MAVNKSSVQKFARGSEVFICKEMPISMSHFPSGFNAIVEYTYKQRYGGDNIDSYSIIVLDENKEPTNAIAWYYENQLTLISDDVARGKEIIEKYNFKN